MESLLQNAGADSMFVVVKIVSLMSPNFKTENENELRHIQSLVVPPLQLKS